jgi:pyroglutamyl-peptidase
VIANASGHTRDDAEWHTRCSTPGVLELRKLAVVVLVASCASTEPPPPPDPNAGLLRDFLDGKFDGAGHPFNGRVTEGEVLCAPAGPTMDNAVRLDAACHATLPGAEQSGDMIVNARLRVTSHTGDGDVVAIQLRDSSNTMVGGDTLTVARLRDGNDWLDLPVTWSSSGGAIQIDIAPANGAVVELDYVEVFPQRFGLVLAPGSGVFGDGDQLTFEASHALTKIEADGVDLTDSFNALVAAGTATETSTEFRTLSMVDVGDLLPGRGDVSELAVHTSSDTSRMQLRSAASACNFVGDAGGIKVLITGFQPFPADADHDNVSGVAVTAVDPSHLHGAQLMKLVLPVEYDLAAAEVTDAIARCQPSLVISFGQGGDAIALEEVAYNLQDTGEVSGGVPDNRGIIRAAVPIDASAPATRDTLLPIDAIETALDAVGESPEHSRDPGRYVCNNVFFADVGAMMGHGRAGFIHLPYTVDFDDSVRARFAKVVETAVQTAVDTQ